MATYYVDSNASGANDGSSPTDAYADLSTYLADTPAAGDVVLCDYQHSKIYTGGTKTLSFYPGSMVISVDFDDSNKFRAGATEGCSDQYFQLYDTNVANFQRIEFCGMTFRQNGGYDLRITTIRFGSLLTFRKCTFMLAADNANCRMQVSQQNGYDALIHFDQCTFDGGDNNYYSAFIYCPGAHMVFTAPVFANISNGSKRFIRPYNLGTTIVTVTDADLSGFSANVIYDNSSNLHFLAMRCSVYSAGVLFSATIPDSQQEMMFEYCSDDQISGTPLPLCIVSSGTEYPGYYAYHGTAMSSAAVYRTASDGENSFSYKLATNANAKTTHVLSCPHSFTTWHDASGSKTLTVYCGSDDSGLYDDDVWLEVSYNDDAATAYTTGEFISTRPGYGAEAAAGTSTYLKTDSSTWAGTGPSTKYKFEFTGIDPTEPGPITVRVFVAKPSINFWVCPNLELTAE